MISVLAPALNEEANIAGTIETVFGAARSAGDVPVELIAVNDGSTDRTGEIIDEFARRDPRFMIVPGDNDAPADLLAAVMRAASRADVVLNYWLNKEERGRRRNVLSTLYNTIYMVTFDIFVQYLNGVTVYPTERLKQLQLRSTRFSICAEATIKVLRTGCTFCEVPGYMQTGLEGSTSLGLRNLLEVVRTYLILIWEINVSQRALYAGRPRRVRL
jgi:glycosyltransferase involved in cell wall biosynthesis